MSPVGLFDAAASYKLLSKTVSVAGLGGELVVVVGDKAGEGVPGDEKTIKVKEEVEEEVYVNDKTIEREE